MNEREQFLKRQQVLADFGDLALRSEDLDEVLTEACRLISDALGTKRAKVLEIQEGGSELLMRAGVGWRPEIVGHVRLPLAEHSSETYSIKEGVPVISQDIHQEKRFPIPDFMKSENVRALVNVPIFLPGMRPYGLLQVDNTEPRSFEDEDTQFLRTYATILGSVIDRLLKVRALTAGEQHFQHIVENAKDYAIFFTDTENRITDWNVGAQSVFGWSPEDIVGQSARILFTPEDRADGEDEKEIATARREGSAPDVRWHLRKDGGRVFIEGVNQALRNHNGELTGFMKIGQDVTSRREMEKRARDSEQQLVQFGEAATDALWIRNAESMQFNYVSPAFETVYGISREAVQVGNDFRRWAELIHPEDRDKTIDIIRQVRAGERIMQEFRIIRPSDGETRWIRDTSFPIFDDNGAVQRIAGIGRDITEEKATADRMIVLFAELQHRTRNLVGVVRSLAERTAEGAGSLETFLPTFQQRLSTLASVNRLLSNLNPGGRVTFAELVRNELKARGFLDDGPSERLVLDGPEDVRLPSAIVQTFGLAIHELATNAVKYGALANGSGRLLVRWRVNRVPESEAERLHVEWIESGVADMPEPGAAPRGGGYGRKLIERALPYQLRAETTYELGPDGVRCTINVPLSST